MHVHSRSALVLIDRNTMPDKNRTRSKMEQQKVSLSLSLSPYTFSFFLLLPSVIVIARFFFHVTEKDATTNFASWDAEKKDLPVWKIYFMCSSERNASVKNCYRQIYLSVLSGVRATKKAAEYNERDFFLWKILPLSFLQSRYIWWRPAPSLARSREMS